MTDNNQTALAPTVEPTGLAAALTGDTNFDFRSLVTVLTAGAERELKTEAKSLRTVVNGRKGEIERANADLRAAQIAQVEGVIGDTEPVLGFFQKAAATASVSINTRDSYPREGEGWAWNVCVKVGEGNGYRNELSTPDVFVSWEDSDEHVSRHHEQLNHLEARQKEDQARALEIRRRLGDLPSLERQIQSAFVTQKLSETEDGRELLGQLQEVAAQAVEGWDPGLQIAALLPDTASS